MSSYTHLTLLVWQRVSTAEHKTLLLLKSVCILAGMRPCGVIVLLGELFISESKTQVYGYLHNFFAMHPDVAKCIGKGSNYEN